MMNPIKKHKWLLVLLFIHLNTKAVLAQSKADIFDGKTPVTWLGLDYTQARFITPEIGTKSAFTITDAEFQNTYIPAWNYLFMTEPKKYNVAKAIHRASVSYALSVTEKANKAVKKEFLSKNPADYKTLTEQNIADLVKKYNFQGNTGIGMLFFVEGMSDRTVYLTDKIGGFGFRNHWADANFRILRQIESDYATWARK